MADKSIVSNSKLTAIANAIRSKTGTTASLTLDAMANEINSIETGTSSVNVMKTLLDGRNNTAYLFQSYTGTSVDNIISYSDTSNVTNMEYMFYNCRNLQTIPQLDTSKVTTMGNMFYLCSKLQTIPQLDTSNVKNMGYMFYQCHNLQTIDITSLDKVTSVSNMGNFAYQCYYLTKLIIRTMTVIPPLNTNSFTDCYRFTGTVNFTYNPEGLKDGRIYVPDDKVEELKQATNWSAYADIIVPLSTLTE